MAQRGRGVWLDAEDVSALAAWLQPFADRNAVPFRCRGPVATVLAEDAAIKAEFVSRETRDLPKPAKPASRSETFLSVSCVAGVTGWSEQYVRRLCREEAGADCTRSAAGEWRIPASTGRRWQRRARAVPDE